MRGVVNRLEEMNRDLDESNVELLRTLGAVIDAYDAYTYGHSTQVAIYARTLGEKLGCSKSELDTLFRAGLIHDLGKIGITDTIIGKEGSLTEEEYNIVKRHTVIGAEIIGQMISLQDLVSLVKHHHERWDGSGYPDGLSGEKIPFGARILALADSLDAMFSERPYRKPLTLSQVETEVRRCSGFQFDPRVVDAFLIIALEKGSAFFKNSAVAVDQSIPDLVQEDFIHRLRYLKKSMISE
jgi:putative nucleotidyltransferase with HDIG domain